MLSEQELHESQPFLSTGGLSDALQITRRPLMEVFGETRDAVHLFKTSLTSLRTASVNLEHTKCPGRIKRRSRTFGVSAKRFSNPKIEKALHWDPSIDYSLLQAAVINCCQFGTVSRADELLLI